ncbi:MAG: hypothetical protein LLF76_10870 [Planctomycetaceae bacterium]|nr:hypothetical protein [Planctomycetaceae bacterium]
MELAMSHADRRIHCIACGRLFKVPDQQKLQNAIDRLEDAASEVFVDEQGNLYG